MQPPSFELTYFTPPRLEFEWPPKVGANALPFKPHTPSGPQTPQQMARTAALKKLMENVQRGVPPQAAFILFLARLDRSGCSLHIPTGWCGYGMPAALSQSESDWFAVINWFEANKRDNPDWLAKMHKELASEDREDKMKGILGCGFMLLMAAFLAWWLIPGVRSLVQRLFS